MATLLPSAVWRWLNHRECAFSSHRRPKPHQSLRQRPGFLRSSFPIISALLAFSTSANSISPLLTLSARRDCPSSPRRGVSIAEGKVCKQVRDRGVASEGRAPMYVAGRNWFFGALSMRPTTTTSSNGHFTMTVRSWGVPVRLGLSWEARTRKLAICTISPGGHFD